MLCVFITEDITTGVQRQKDWETPGGIAPLSECMFMGQRYKMAVVPVFHTLSGASPVLRRNILSWIVTALPGEDPHLVCNVLSTDIRQAEKLRTLRPGEFVCSNPVLWPKPVYVTFSKPSIPGICTESMRRYTVEKFLKNVKTAPPAPLSTFKPAVGTQPDVSNKTQDSLRTKPQLPLLPSRGLEFMTQVITSKPTTVTRIDKRLCLNAMQGRRVRKALEDTGLIRIHAFSTGRVGGRISLVEITDIGWELLSKKGFSRPKVKVGGSWEHQTAAQLVEADGIRSGYKVSFEIPMGSIQADVQWLDTKTGRRTVFFIGISRPRHEVDSIERFFKLPMAADVQVVLVARDTSFAKAVKSDLKSREHGDDMLRRIEIKLVADFVNS